MVLPQESRHPRKPILVTSPASDQRIIVMNEHKDPTGALLIHNVDVASWVQL
jgi:hypothetical protein